MSESIVRAGTLPVPRALLLDLDDTILDTTRSADAVWVATAEAFAEEIGCPAGHIHGVLQEARRWYWSDAKRNLAGRLTVRRSRVEVTRAGLDRLGLSGWDEPRLSDLAGRFTDHYSDHRVAAMRMFDGAAEALEAVRARGIPMVLMTNGDAQGQREKVEHFGLARYFEAVLIEGELGFGKPDDRLYRAALEACGVSYADVWCVGDNHLWEVRRPQELGMTGIWLDWAGVGLSSDSETVPDAVIRGIAELPGLIDAARVACQ